VSSPSRRIHKTYADIADGQVHCRIVSGAAPAILFLHQTATSSRSYEPLLDALDVPNQLVAVDLPGFGESFDPPGMPDIQTYAGWIVETADALGIGQFHIFGHHTGASLAIEIAVRHPDRTRSIMLEGPVFMTDGERAEFAAGYTKPIAPVRDGSHLLENWNYAARYNPDCDVTLIHQEVVAMLRAWRARPQAYGAVAAQDAMTLAQQVTQPVLLLTSPDDFFYPTMDRARALFPDAPVGVTGGGNFQPSADPEGVARAVEAFLVRLRDVEAA